MLAEFTPPLSSALIVAAFTACVIPTSSACTISSFASRPNPSRCATDALSCPRAASTGHATTKRKLTICASFILSATDLLALQPWTPPQTDSHCHLCLARLTIPLGHNLSRCSKGTIPKRHQLH